ncbi:MAG: S-layer homology domain-containing protein [Clostridia bacterium]|nr:S-layer homology domain-containing protein [Clostridia bacterium]
MKNIKSAVLTLVATACLTTAMLTFSASAAKPDKNTMPQEQDIITTVKILGIMNGDENGNLNLEKPVTRAEFTKMAICATTFKDSVNTTSHISPFADVSASHWGSGYIVSAVKNGYLKGYVDGTFRPESEVTLEEAVTVMLRILGYKELDSGRYPDSQLAKYSEMELDVGITAKQGDFLTRRECMYLIYNSLCAETASGTVYCKSLGYDAGTDHRIDYLSLVNSTLKGPFVLKQGEIISDKVPFSVGDDNIYYGTNIISSSQVVVDDVYYYSKELETVWIYRDTETGFVKTISPSKENPTSVTVGSKTYSLEGASVKQQFSNYGSFDIDDFVTIHLGNGGNAVYAKEGDVYQYLKSNDDGVSYADIVSQSIDGPVVVLPGKNWRSDIPFDISKAVFYRENSTVTESAVNDYDVLYYSKVLKSVWMYTDKATGTLEAVSPNRISPTSVTVSGKTYSIESTSAAFSLSNMGTLAYGDTVTLLFGKNGGVVEVVVGAENAETVYGFITGLGEGTYTRQNGTQYTAENISVLGIDGSTRVYEYNHSGFTKGDFVAVSYVDDKLKITGTSSGVSAAIATNINSLLSKGSIADGATILDVVITTDSDSIDNKTVDFCTIYPARLSGAKLSASDIYYAKVEDGLITALVLQDFTGDIHSYGVITAERAGSGLDWYLVSGANKNRITLNTAYGTPSVGAVKYTEKAGKYIVKSLESVVVDKNDFYRGYCVSDGKSYSYSSDVQFYIKTGAREFIPSTYDDILKGDYKICAYYNDTAEKGGRVRVVIAE